MTAFPLTGVTRQRIRNEFWADGERPVPRAIPCPVCGGERVAVTDWANGVPTDRLRFSHSDSCRIGRWEDSMRDRDYRFPSYLFARWSSAEEVEMLTDLGFTRTAPPAFVGTPPVVAEFDPETGEVMNGTSYPQMTFLSFPTAGAAVRLRVFPDLIEPELTEPDLIEPEGI